MQGGGVMALAGERPQSGSPGVGAGVSQVSGGGFRVVVDTGLAVIGEAGLEIAVWGSQPLE